MHNIPFQIIDPGLNAGKSCIVLKGNYKPYFPKEVKGIKVGKSTTKLYFLHTCAWGWPEGAEAAKYVIHYQDGTKIELPLRVNIEIRDWFSDPEPIPRAEIAWQGKCLTKSGQIAVYSMEWTNPYPDKIINSIDFVSAENDPVPVLIAITGHHTL